MKKIYIIMILAKWNLGTIRDDKKLTTETLRSRRCTDKLFEALPQ